MVGYGFLLTLAKRANFSINVQIPNSFSFSVTANDCLELTGTTDIELIQNNHLVVGQGSNLLFVDGHFDGQLILCQHQQLTIEQDDAFYWVHAGAGLNWHQLVLSLIAQGVAGLENLSLIPGTVGAAPVQNIGAYGVELSDVVASVSGIDLNLKQRVTLSNVDCQFGYRDSIFKRKLKGQFIIEQVTFKLSKHWQAKTTYGPLQDLSTDVDALALSQRVCQIRLQKLPDPNVLGNAGSFFKNPIIDKNQAQALQQRLPLLPIYPTQDNNKVKIAAGFLIEQAGLKGLQHKGVAVHDKQALVLVNKGQGTPQQIVELAAIVQQRVVQQFSILLEPEVRFIAANGEVNATALLSQVPYTQGAKQDLS